MRSYPDFLKVDFGGQQEVLASLEEVQKWIVF